MHSRLKTKAMLTAISFLTLISSPLRSESEMRLADSKFANELCAGWNSSRLPKLLGTEEAGGNGWINKITSRGVPEQQPAGYQKIVSGRSDCKNWDKFELVIERQTDGTAKCTSAGSYNGKRVTWQFLPSTAGWFEYAENFGLGAFMSLWNNGMVGDYTTAYANRGNFQIFFRIAGKIGLKSDYKSGCDGLDTEEAEESYKKLQGD